MTNADKARQTLVDSMRKSKAGSSQPSKAPASKAAAAKPAAPKKAAPKKVVKKRVPAQPKVSRSTPAAATKPKMATDPYQSSRRIWPD